MADLKEKDVKDRKKTSKYFEKKNSQVVREKVDVKNESDSEKREVKKKLSTSFVQPGEKPMNVNFPNLMMLPMPGVFPMMPGFSSFKENIKILQAFNIQMSAAIAQYRTLIKLKK